MRFVEMVFREVNVVLVHSGVAVPAISLDRVRSARPASNLQVTFTQGALAVLYPDERLALQLDPQRITATDSGGRPPESSPVVEAALAQHVAIGGPEGTAFGYNIRFDFRVEGLDRPGDHLAGGVIRSPEAIAGALRADSFQFGLKLVYTRGVKIWTVQIEPVFVTPERMLVHANVHEDLKRPQPHDPDAPPPPLWLQGGGLENVGAGFPSAESMKADLALQARTALETVAALLSLKAEG